MTPSCRPVGGGPKRAQETSVFERIADHFVIDIGIIRCCQTRRSPAAGISRGWVSGGRYNHIRFGTLVEELSELTHCASVPAVVVRVSCPYIH